MSDVESRVCSVLLDRGLTHSAFRLYCAIAVLLDGESRDVTTGVAVSELKALVPGVKGKPLGESSLRAGLRELQAHGLIEIAGPQWSKISLQLRLLGGGEDPDDVRARLYETLLKEPGWVRTSS